MKTSNVGESQNEADQDAKYEEMLARLDEENKQCGLPIKEYVKRREALQRYNPDYACYFSDNEPDWMKPISASYRSSITRKLTDPSFEHDAGRILAKPITILLYGTGITIIDVCIFGAMQFIPQQYRYIPMLVVPITNIPMLYWLVSTCNNITAGNKAREEQLAHYQSLSTEQLLREAHRQDLGNARSVYTPDEVTK